MNYRTLLAASRALNGSPEEGTEAAPRSPVDSASLKLPARVPEAYALRGLRGWKAMCNWAKVGDELYETYELAVKFCEQLAKADLIWREDGKTPEGHMLFSGCLPDAPDRALAAWRVWPEYFPRTRVPIPDAAFVSQDSACHIYVRHIVEESSKRWFVYEQHDHEAEALALHIRWSEPGDDAPFCPPPDALESMLLAIEDTEQGAIEVARYYWALSLLSSAKVPAFRSRSKRAIRNFCVQVLLKNPLQFS